MGLKEVLEEEIDEERLNGIFDALFVSPQAEISPGFYEEELDGAAIQYPLLRQILERTDDLILAWREQGRSERDIDTFLQGRAVPCLVIAAYISSDVESEL